MTARSAVAGSQELSPMWQEHPAQANPLPPEGRCLDGDAGAHPAVAGWRLECTWWVRSITSAASMTACARSDPTGGASGHSVLRRWQRGSRSLLERSGVVDLQNRAAAVCGTQETRAQTETGLSACYGGGMRATPVFWGATGIFYLIGYASVLP